MKGIHSLGIDRIWAWTRPPPTGETCETRWTLPSAFRIPRVRPHESVSEHRPVAGANTSTHTHTLPIYTPTHRQQPSSKPTFATWFAVTYGLGHLQYAYCIAVRYCCFATASVRGRSDPSRTLPSYSWTTAAQRALPSPLRRFRFDIGANVTHQSVCEPATLTLAIGRELAGWT